MRTVMAAVQAPPLPLGSPNERRCESNGVFFGNSQIAIKQITDGTGKTFMIGERDKFCLAGTWLGARNPRDGAEIHSSLWTLGHVAGIVTLNYPITAAYDTCPEGFSSAHAGGGFFAFCDGSVHFISDDISFSTNGKFQDVFRQRSRAVHSFDYNCNYDCVNRRLPAARLAG